MKKSSVPAGKPNAPVSTKIAAPVSLSFEPPVDFADPRLRPDFKPEDWPLCNGEPTPPPGSPGLHERRCVEFLAAFYRINVLKHRLLAARTKRASKAVIKAILDDIEAATEALEQLEDRYAPIGFFGDPVMEGMRYQNIEFVRPELSRIYSTASELSSYFAIPGLEEIPPSELRGPAKIIRLGHGKVDF